MTVATRPQHLVTWLATAALASACGGGSSGSGTTGVFIDSVVDGLRYVGPTFSGTTTQSGQYQYVPGEEVCFFLGIIPLGCATARGILSPIDLFPGADSGDDRVLNLVRFLLSLDADGDPSNGIGVRGVATVAADADLDFDQSGDAFGSDPDVLAFVAAQGFDGDLVDEETAADHLYASLDDSLYFEQDLLGDWLYTRFEGESPSQATTVKIDEKEIAATDGDVTEEGDVFFTLDGVGAGEICIHEGAFEDDDVIAGFIDCFVPAQAAASVSIFDTFRMDRLDGSSVYEAADLLGDWYRVSSFAAAAFFIAEEDLVGLVASVSPSGVIHFQTVEDLEAEGETCVYDGQMNAAKDFASGTVLCSTAGTGSFTMESPLDVF